MPLNEFEQKKCELLLSKFVEKRRPPAAMRDKLDYGFRIKGLSVELFEIRPAWDNPKVKIDAPFAKATYVNTEKIWKVYWQRADLKWHRYQPDPEVDTI